MFPATQIDLSVPSQDRRQHQRFPIAATAKYDLHGIKGQAVAANISSGGVFLKGSHLPVRKSIQVWIDWPVLLDNRCPLRLVIVGTTLRSDDEGTAVKIGR